jgi:hypothetical protein
MKRKLMIVGLLSLLLGAIGQPVSAQRLLPNQNGLEVMGGIIFQPRVSNPINSGDFSVEAGYNHYFRVGNYLSVTADYEQRHYTYKEWRIPIQDALLQVSYNHPLVMNRGRDVLLYAGIAALGGYEFVNNGETLMPNGATLQNQSRWVYGVSPMISLETYLHDRLVFVLRGEGRFLFNQQTYLIRPTIQAGLRVII